MGGNPGLSIPRLKALSDGHTANRREELLQLWVVIRHAQTDDDDPHSVIEAAVPAAQQHHDDSDGEPGFDAVAMVRAQQHKTERR